jgi:hypothetical protein
MVSPEKIVDKQRELLATMASSSPLLQRFPPERYVESLQNATGPYNRLPSEIVDISEVIETDFGTLVAEKFHQLILLKLIERFYHVDQSYPESVRHFFDRHFLSVLSRIDEPPPNYFLYTNDAFVKDLAVATRRMIPCGAQLVDVASGIPRNCLLASGLSQFISMARFTLGRLGGFRPLYEMHMDARLILDFNSSGWITCYQRIGELMESHSQVRGVFGSSWWFDPAVSTVSPRLAFLREMPLAHGARVFQMTPDKQSVIDAVANSPQREKLVKEGKYRPRKHALIWARKDLLVWKNSLAGR